MKEKHSNGAKRIVAVLATLTMAATMIVMPVNAAEATGWTPPTEPLTVNQSVITTGAHRAAQVAPEILGLNNVATHELGGQINTISNTGSPTYIAPLKSIAAEKSTTGSDEKGTTSNAMLGMFGSNVNDNPNPYLWNYFYNSYANENGKDISPDAIYLMPFMASPAAADVSPYTWPDDESVSVTLRRRPDILVGTGANKVTTVNEGKASTSNNKIDYTVPISEMKENKDEDPNNDYNPYKINWQMTTTYTMAKSLREMAKDANEIMAADSTKTTRYGNPEIIAKDYEKYIKGTSLYVMSEIAKGTVTKKKVAVITSVPVNGTAWFQTYAYGTKDGTASSNRQAEYLHYTTDNLYTLYKDDSSKVSTQSVTTTASDGSTTTSEFACLNASALMDADYIIFAGQSSGTDMGQASSTVAKFKTTMEDLGYDTNKLPPIFSTLPSCIYGITMNSAENALGFGFFNGFIYPELINQAYSTAFVYEKLFHISNQSALATAIDQNLKTASLASGATTDLTNYYSRDYEEKLTQGMKYWEANSSTLAAELGPDDGKWDWDTGIKLCNSAVEATNKDVVATISGKSQIDLKKAIVSNFTDAEKSLYENGAKLDVDVAINSVDEKNIDATVLEKIKEASGKDKKNIGAYLNIDISYTLGENKAVSVVDLGNNELEITVTLPEALQGKENYVIYREHNGTVTVITPTVSADGKTLTFKSAQFSTFAIAYEDKIANTADDTTIVSTVFTVTIALAGLAVIVNKKHEEE